VISVNKRIDCDVLQARLSETLSRSDGAPLPDYANVITNDIQLETVVESGLSPQDQLTPIPVIWMQPACGFAEFQALTSATVNNSGDFESKLQPDRRLEWFAGLRRCSQYSANCV
jgi:hypothetical protein